MFLFSFRLKKHHVAIGFAVVAIIAALGVIGVKNAFMPVSATAGPKASQSQAKAGKAKTAGKTNDDRITFLSSYGWQVENDPVEILEVIIPEEFDSVYEAYNEMQKLQGFDLSSFAGKRCKRYAYRVIGYPGSDEAVRAHIIVYKDKIIGGDVCSEVSGSFMHGFAIS